MPTYVRHAVSEEPRIRVLQGFLEPEECDALVGQAADRLEPAQMLFYDTGTWRPSERRTNSTAPVHSDAVRARIAEATGLPVRALEGAVVNRYRPGEEFKPHYDFLEPGAPGVDAELASMGQRLVTFLIWLSDEYEGGETAFPRLGMHFKGRKGDAIYWTNVDRNKQPDERTLHASLPVRTGEKWLLTQLIRGRELPDAMLERFRTRTRIADETIASPELAVRSGQP